MIDEPTTLYDWSPPRDQAIDDHDDRDHEEDVDDASHVKREEAEQPQNEQNDRDGPEHVSALVEWCVLHCGLRLGNDHTGPAVRGGVGAVADEVATGVTSTRRPAAPPVTACVCRARRMRAARTSCPTSMSR